MDEAEREALLAAALGSSSSGRLASAAGAGSSGGGSGGGGGGSGLACDVCGGPRADAKWLEAFGTALCWDCKKADGLVSKSRAKAEYLLSDADLRGLGSLEKPNPQHPSWTAMRMYLASQVREVALRKHGSLSLIEATKEERADKKFRAAAEQRKRGAAEAAKQEQEEARMAARVEARAARLAKEAEAAQRARIEETVDPETGAKRRRHGPQLAEVEVETI